MTAIDLSILSPTDWALVDEALRILGGEVIAITTTPAKQVMLPMAGMAAPTEKQTRRRGRA
jgi:hypothetical protein